VAAQSFKVQTRGSTKAYLKTYSDPMNCSPGTPGKTGACSIKTLSRVGNVYGLAFAGLGATTLVIMALSITTIRITVTIE
jgi:hypothetical protein